MDKQIEELLRKANGAIDKAIELAPELINAYILYIVTWSILEPIIIGAMTFIVIYFGRKGMADEKSSYKNDIYFFGKWGGGKAIVLNIVAWVLIIILFISVITCVRDLVLISISKEVYLINRFIR